MTEDSLQHLQNLVLRWAAAQVSGDAETLSRILGEGFDWLIPEGHVVDKARFLKDLRSSAWRPNVVEPTDVRVRFCGENPAILRTRVTFRWHEEEIAMRALEDITFVCAREWNEWQFIAGHSSAPNAKIEYREDAGSNGLSKEEA